MRIKLMVSSILAASLLVFGVSSAVAAPGGNNSQQAGLVNVSTGDVALLNNVNAAVAANVLVTACDLTVGVAALALQQLADTGTTTCTSLAGPITIDQDQPGGGPGDNILGGGNNSNQVGLVNVSLGDVAILNNVNVGVAANVLVTACDLTVGAAILAVQGLADTGTTTCTSAAGPISLTQA
jgi:uncharacterized membrane protein (Fun14 family)